MSPDLHPDLIHRLLETISLAECLEGQNPPNPVTRAALHHSMQDLVGFLKAMDPGFTAVSSE